MNKIACIYIQERDGTTSFLEPIIEHIRNVFAPVIVGYDIDSEDDPLEIIYQTASSAEIVFFIGHGTSDKLYASTTDNLALYYKDNIAQLTGKRLFLLSCNSVDFIKKHRLINAFGFGMLPTSLDDVRKWKDLHGIHIEDFSSDDITIYNNSIVETLKKAITTDSIYDFSLLKERIKFYANAEIAKYLIYHRNNANYRNLTDLIFYFQKDIAIQ